jgi:hypothetical protein
VTKGGFSYAIKLCSPTTKWHSNRLHGNWILIKLMHGKGMHCLWILKMVLFAMLIFSRFKRAFLKHFLMSLLTSMFRDPYKVKLL